ncbi:MULTISPECIES: DUF3300 domain-containing protein [Rhizobium]|uniref:DUF3300 domain-containing protein n=1 Tax=Rhizobium TaxID=379 RepID=UPI001B33514B|nr:MULTISPECIES: DUF3300 domain-containing protein [Rhizobium]MBX4908433.1 DUF3300 domain-containing protein [Rhizobium bangladeshense]MBX5214466.1 DUF3300 domain-containing protein [Rhizobium sp. NLR9a]MBX5222261.1 DUF3300 domain-containing protein [Rhizobium sp. NLR8a]MBX5227562.1 DUF3300 domain-containing protein [Rhizobium sp. NLR9b]MBX5233650.1 DUF3300 domain-containing protein [Rhizobium sp. NLR4a]
MKAIPHKVSGAQFFAGQLIAGLSVVAIITLQLALPARAQAPAPAAAPTQTAAEQPAAALLSDDELEVLVARIALYPDELVAAISAASLFPLQIVEAQRFLEAKKKNSDLKPKSDWDGSVISLLNYPDVVKMMSEDLDWTQSLADALTNQQKDVLIAIQQLRDEAVEKNIIKTDDKVTVVTENENIIIRPTDPEKIYIPQYPPEMLYEPGYASEPISYYPDYYDSYYYPGAGFFAAAVTGLTWAAIVNWDDWGVWGGRWDGDIDIDCNNCLNDRNFNGKLKFNDVDWSNVDRSKLSIGKDQFAKLDRSSIKSSLQSDNRNQLRNRANDIQASQRPGNRGNAARAEDIRKNTAQGLKAKPAANRPAASDRQGASRPEARPQKAANRPAKPAQKSVKKANKPQMASRPDNRGRQPSALGNPQSGRREAVSSHRGAQSMGQRPSARPPQYSRPSGGGGGRGGGGRGGGGRGGGGRR